MKKTVVFTLIFITMAYTISAQEWGVLSIELGKENEENGVIERNDGTAGDGITEADEIGDKDCKFIPKTPPGLGATGNHIYLIVDPTVIANKAKTDELWIAIEFLDSATTAKGILLDYDNKGDAVPDQAFALNVPQPQRTINFTNTDEWQIAILHIEDAEFKEQGNGADFRYHIVDYMSEGFYVHKVWVSDHELTLDELGADKPVSVQGKIASLWSELKGL